MIVCFPAGRRNRVLLCDPQSTSTQPQNKQLPKDESQRVGFDPGPERRLEPRRERWKCGLCGGGLSTSFSSCLCSLLDRHTVFLLVDTRANLWHGAIRHQYCPCLSVSAGSWTADRSERRNLPFAHLEISALIQGGCVFAQSSLNRFKNFCLCSLAYWEPFCSENHKPGGLMGFYDVSRPTESISLVIFCPLHFILKPT